MPRPLLWRGANRYELSPTLTSLALPAAVGGDPDSGARLGDLLVLVGNVGGGTFTVTDARFTKVADLSNSYPSLAEVWVGYADTLDPVSLTATFDGSGNPQHVMVAAWGNVRYDGRKAELVTSASPFTLPALSGTGLGALAVVTASHNIGDWVWSGAPGYTTRYSAGSYNEISIGTIEAATVASADSGWSAGGIPTHAIILGLSGIPTVAPPCRLIRDDDLGVGGARLYPPPKSQQRSSRGVGYY